MKKDISKTTKTQKQGNGKRKQLRENEAECGGVEDRQEEEGQAE